MTKLRDRLEEYLSANKISATIEPITPDASTREYFRFTSDGSSKVACVYPDDIKHLAHSYVDVTNVFLSNDLPVARIHEFDEVLGVVVVEDLGDQILRAELEQKGVAERDEMIRDSIKMIAQIQASTASAAEAGSICSRLKFDVEKLMWELNYFKIHYFTTYKKEPLTPEMDSALEEEFMSLANQLDSMATVLCHRDFHAANIMIGEDGRLRIIDHQDARMGSPAYDLVSLLLDRVVEIPSNEWISEMIEYFHDERESLGLEKLDRNAFAIEFKLQTIQRCLKAAGTFSFQSAVRGKTYFIPFIEPMFRIVDANADGLGSFPAIRRVLTDELAQTRR